MRIAVLILFLCIAVLSGCAKKDDNTYVGVEEKETTIEIINTPYQPTENDDSIDKEKVKLYIDDSHFYDYDEGINFAEEYEKKEKFHIKVLEAYSSDNLIDFGEYFNSSIIKEEIEENINQCIERKGYSTDDITYMCVKVEITNKSSEKVNLCLGNYLKVFTRLHDERGKEFKLADKYISLATANSEFWYDSPKKENEKNLYYYLNFEAGETITTNCVYIMRKEYLDDDLYFQLHLDEGEYNAKYNCTFPPTAETTKFLKINLNKNN